MNVIRKKVSLNKRRYTQEGFDLDLTYITNRVIAMGFPAVGIEGFYRNPRSDVKKFLEFKHTGKYKVYNLCIEKSRAYDADVFDNRASRYPFQDHQAPPLEMIGQFCSDVDKWLEEDPANVVAVHCKAGKGRAGMMICCYLVHSKAFPTAAEAMVHYAKERTYDMEGVTIPSQRRYVTYYEDIVKAGYPTAPKIKLSNIEVSTSKYVHAATTQIFCVLYSRLQGLDKEVFKSTPLNQEASKDAKIDMGNIEVEGDIKIVFFDKSIDKEKEVFHLWFNTAFIHDNVLVLTKPEIDKAWNDRKCKKYGTDFTITLHFKGAEVGAMSKLKSKGGKREKKERKEKREKKEKRDKKSKKDKKAKKETKESTSKKESPRTITEEEEKEKKPKRKEDDQKIGEEKTADLLESPQAEQKDLTLEKKASTNTREAEAKKEQDEEKKPAAVVPEPEKVAPVKEEKPKEKPEEPKKVEEQPKKVEEPAKPVEKTLSASSSKSSSSKVSVSDSESESSSASSSSSEEINVPLPTPQEDVPPSKPVGKGDILSDGTSSESSEEDESSSEEDSSSEEEK